MLIDNPTIKKLQVGAVPDIEGDVVELNKDGDVKVYCHHVGIGRMCLRTSPCVSPKCDSLSCTLLKTENVPGGGGKKIYYYERTA